MKEQFAGWGMYDNSAICLTCKHQHLIPKAEQVTSQPWLDWQTKHAGHETLILPHKLLSQIAGSQLAHNADVKITYAASAAYTITLASLATSSTLLVGRESTWISNASTKYLDGLVAGRIMVGTTPTANTLIEVHALGTQNDAPTYPPYGTGGSFSGTDGPITLGNAQLKGAICKPVAIIPVVATTSDFPYGFAPLGIRQLFGDGLPSSHGLFVTHSTAVNLNSTGGNHVLSHTPVFATVI